MLASVILSKEHMQPYWLLVIFKKKIVFVFFIFLLLSVFVFST